MTEHQEEKAALHVMRMLDAHESRVFESEMRGDQKLRDIVSELEDAAAGIALLLPEQSPPPECRRALLVAHKQRRHATMTAISAPFRAVRNPWLAWAVAAGLVVAAAGLWKSNQELKGKMATLVLGENAARTEAAHAADLNSVNEKKLAEVSGNLAKVKDEMNGEIARLKQTNSVARMEAAVLRSSIKRYEEGVAVLIWDSEKQEGRLKLDKMPAVPPNKDYQLWIVDKAKSTSPVSAGVVKVDQRGTATVTFKPVETVSEAAKFALSVEKQGGVSQKSQDGPIVLIGP
ncbi:MAG: anti-sigma factor [Verrucomicrobiaceae bacterium]